MTYLTFLLLVLIPPIALMLSVHRRPQLESEDLRVDLAIPLVSLIALFYTTPWDNYLVARNVWWYGPDRVLGTIGYVPVEEYLFFLLQPLLTGLFLYQYLGRFATSPKPSSPIASWMGTAIFGGMSALGAVLLLDGRPGTLYLALILTWAPPLLAGMWLYDGETLWALRVPLLVTTALPTLYLWIADAIAIRNQIWTISPEYTLGVSPFGLPIEEATFFLLTNLLVVHGVLLLLYGSHETVTPAQSTP